MNDDITQEEIDEGLSLFYGDSVTIEPPRKKIVRRRGKMLEVEEPAFVKFSTDFKKELKNLNDSSLKVFLYIGLSIGFESGTAYPGTRKIAEDTGLNKDTVTSAVKNLEEMGFLAVFRKQGSSNVYEPTQYFSVGRAVRKNGTDAELSELETKLSEQNEKLSERSRVNLLNKNNKNNNTLSEQTQKAVLQNSDPAWSLLAGEKIGQGQVDAIKLEKEALDIFEIDMGLPKNWSWYPAKSSEEKAWKDLRDFVVAQYKKDSKCFQTYQTWRTQPFARGAMSNLAIRRNPENFPASWTDFLASNAMYGKKDAPEVKKDDNDLPMSYA